MSQLAIRTDDDACNLSCDGNVAEICGGILKISVRIPRPIAALIADRRLTCCSAVQEDR